MPIEPVAIDNFVREEGELVYHYAAIVCPCQDDKGMPDPNCKLHELGGYRYVDGRQITGLITGIENRKELMASGLFLPADCLFSPLSEEKIAEHDKIVFTWPLPFSGDVVLRSDIEDFDYLSYEADKAMVCIGDDENATRYYEGVDFQLDGKKIIWEWEGKEGAKPDVGTRYSIRYKAFIEWIAFIPPSNRVSHGFDIGDKVFLRRKHLLER